MVACDYTVVEGYLVDRAGWSDCVVEYSDVVVHDSASSDSTSFDGCGTVPSCMSCWCGDAMLATTSIVSD